MRYIGFDGVIIDTEDILLYDWINYPERFNMPWDTLDRYIERAMWKKILEQAPVINDAIYILKNMDCNDTSIITKVHSLDNEGAAKIKHNIVLVPYNLSICDVVSAKDNLLIDVNINNLDEWKSYGGCPMFFDKNKNNIDDYYLYNNKKYQRVLRIDANKN